MYNGHDFLSCIKIPVTKQAVAKKSEKMESMDFAAEHRDLISTANKVFGEEKWNHTIVHQTLDYVEIIGAKCNVGCVSSVKVQLENGTFHEDIGYYSAEESTKGLSIHNARIGSAVNGLRRALLSFGGKIERELQSQKQINPKQTNDKQKNIVQSANKQIEGKSNVSIQAPICKIEYEDLESDKNKVPVAKKETTDTNPSLSEMINSQEDLQPLLNQEKLMIVQSDKTDTKTEDSSKQALSANEIQRIERKRKQLEKQMEFKKRMKAKEEQVLNNSNPKPNPKY
ncbi:DNA repair protein RAD52 homolog isoform X2 [Camponotus floridanus]|uniref:DNA repair protein RAD52 homolog isoform X2 n=1 Tax=Camponotus floridanus TaxID=104421 RepID=UPI000DC68351|nr:DNA repair protein RAD52 homolog isoform X2 [Camponotus floridanus]